MKCSEIMAKLEELSPLSFAESWDNVGLLVGSREREVESVMIALDATDAVIDQAVLAGADMLLTHHPLIFSPQNRITAEDFTGKRIIKLIVNDICCYASHTNFDVMGMGDEAAERLALEERSVLEITFEDELSQEGIGRVGILPECMTLRECASYVKETFDLDTVKVFGSTCMPRPAGRRGRILTTVSGICQSSSCARNTGTSCAHSGRCSRPGTAAKRPWRASTCSTSRS